MKVLEELDIIKEEASYIILGVAIMEDIIIISMLAVLQSVSTSGDLSIVDILISISITLAFIFGVLLLGSKIIPKLINFIGKFHQHEVLLLLVVLGLAFGLSFLYWLFWDLHLDYLSYLIK